MRHTLMVLLVITQMLISLASAEEMPGKGNLDRYNKTLPGMPLPDKASPRGTLKGFIYSVGGTPLTGGDVYFFNEVTGPPPAPEKYWRVPDMLGEVDEKGGFSVDLPPGRYYLGAIQRKGDNALIGPPAVGDLYYAGNTVYNVLTSVENNLDVIRGAKPLSIDFEAERSGVTAIEGSVVDSKGKGVENAVVFAIIKSEMDDRPLFVSSRTGKDGVYRLRVAGDGTFYLRVRDIYGGGMPVTGALIGEYGGENPIPVTVKKGEVLKGIDLVGFEFAKPVGKQP